MTETRLSDLPAEAFDERHLIELLPLSSKQSNYTLGELVDYVAAQALKKVRRDMFRVPEVEIERSFRDPDARIDAMDTFVQMWSHINATQWGGILVYTNVRNGMIVWKWSFSSTEEAIAFDKSFETRDAAACEAKQRAFDNPNTLIRAGETVTVTG